jgi:flagellum-specific ATP synthase
MAEALIEKAGRDWMTALARVGSESRRYAKPVVEGVLTRMVGLTLEASGCQAPIGARCDVVNSIGDRVETEVVGFSGDSLYLMPTSEVHGLVPNARVIPTRHGSDVSVGPELLGRVIDGRGRPLDEKGPLRARQKIALQGKEINPLARTPIHEELDVGVRAINALCPIGRGQRMGLFAGSGVGKSDALHRGRYRRRRANRRAWPRGQGIRAGNSR